MNEQHRGCGDSPHLAIAKPTARDACARRKAVANAFHDGCDAVIAIVHGGEEYAPQTHAMMTLARAAAEAGADAVVFHHPHVVSPIVVYDTEDGRHVPIFASLGNLVSNQGESWTPDYPATQKDRHIVYLNGWTRLGMIADLQFRLDARARRSSRLGATTSSSSTATTSSTSRTRTPTSPRACSTRAATREIIDKLSRDAAVPARSSTIRAGSTNGVPFLRRAGLK